jgi:putative ABC transport system permease protein
MTEWRSSKLDSYTYSQFTTFVQLQRGASGKEFSRKISGIVKKYLPESKKEILLQPLKSAHLHSTHINNWTVVYPNPGNITYVYIFSFTAFCILVIACINFMNLATARSGTRAKEVGMRKVVGARRKDLIKQFTGESLLYSLFALMTALLLVILLLPTFNSLSGKQISLGTQGNLNIIIGLTAIAFLTGILSGSYPALFLSAFQPTQVIRNINQSGSRRSGTLRKILVIGQFTITIGLIFITTVIYNQIHFMQHKNLGFEKDKIIMFASYGDYGRKYEASKQELLQNPNIQSISRCFPPSRGNRPTTDVSWDGKDPSSEILMYSEIVDYDFLKTFGLKMAEGRFYSREFSTDPENYVVNETAVKVMEMESPIGKQLTIGEEKGTIIGVVKDYHGGSLHEMITPKILKFSGRGFFVSVKFQGNTSSMVGFLEEKWKKFVGDYPFRYNFFDESINNWYYTEKRFGKIIQYFTGLAIFVACLGLFGLASFMAERRTKEIGIRKVLGANVSGIVILLSKEFSKWVLISNIIALPAAYLIGKNWLQGFAYRIGLGPEIFIFSTATALIIALFTIGYQAIKAASANPVESLRYE